MNSSKILFNQLVLEITPVYEENEAKSIIYLLLEHYLNLSKTDIFLDKNIIQAFDFQDIIQRIKAQEPVQYVIGETEFYGRKFKVTPATLIPRPETEELVQLILEAPRSVGRPAPRGGAFESKARVLASPLGAGGAILDIGTGSGCIAISLACELPDAQVYAYDISEEALKIAKENAERNGANVIFEKVDILTAPSAPKGGTKNGLESSSSGGGATDASGGYPFSIIVSNPPYVMNAEKAEMERNILEYEPHLALFVEDNDPLIFYLKIAEFAAKNLIDKGLCVVEINQAFGLETAELFWNKGFSDVEVLKDMFGKDRMVKAVL
jgi:release factor glutamine methyltransferase